MRRFSLISLLTTVALSLAGWYVVSQLCLLMGSSGSIGWPSDPAVLSIRRDSVMIASLVGAAALACAGAVYQAILQNPLADPYLLGVSSGAMLFSYLWQLPAITVGVALGEQCFSFVGAIAAVAVVFALASRRGRLEPMTMLLVGVIVNAVNGSIFLLLNNIVKDPARPGGALSFLVGGLQENLGRTSSQVITAGIIIGAGVIAMLAIAGQLNVGLLSESETQSLGVRVHRLRWIAMIVASLITASAVAISGPIGFVGLVCPHLARLIVGNDQRRLLPLSTAMGAALLAIAQQVSHWLSSRPGVGTILPVGVLTGLLGGPFFLLLLWKQRRAAA